MRAQTAPRANRARQRQLNNESGAADAIVPAVGSAPCQALLALLWPQLAAFLEHTEIQRMLQYGGLAGTIPSQQTVPPSAQAAALGRPAASTERPQVFAEGPCGFLAPTAGTGQLDGQQSAGGRGKGYAHESTQRWVQALAHRPGLVGSHLVGAALAFPWHGLVACNQSDWQRCQHRCWVRCLSMVTWNRWSTVGGQNRAT
jgi:hypothetical protein